MAALRAFTLQRIAIASVGVGVAALGLKVVAYAVTGSIALYSDALESIVNVVTAIGALVALHYSAKPADANHPYGHYKAEYFSVILEGVMIVVASVSILHEAYLGLTAPHGIAAPVLGLLINGAATALNGAWGMFLVRVGRRRRSLVLVADGKHLLTDVATSAAVFVGLGLSIVTGLAILDPLLAGLVALNILWSGWGLIRESVGGLMDESASNDILERVRAVISDSAAGALEVHDLRTRQAGRAIFIDFHLVVPGSMPVSAAHNICDTIEKALRSAIEDALITIHVEPEEKAKHRGVLVL
jgi:cation diffusion facilitator family transporter